MEPDQLKLAVEEFKALRSEIANTVKAIAFLEKVVGGACAAIYVWLFNQKHPVIWWIWTVPVLITFLGGLRALALGRRFFSISDYIYTIEGAVYPAGNNISGWEHFHREHPRWWLIDGIIEFGFWFVLFLVTVAAAVYFYHYPIASGSN